MNGEKGKITFFSRFTLLIIAIELLHFGLWKRVPLILAPNNDLLSFAYHLVVKVQYFF